MKVFIGWDSREDIAYQVCKYSIEKNSTIPVEVIPLKQTDLREQKLYWREVDQLASTEFTFTRFLVPHLTGYKGWVVFADCDFLWVDDIKKLLDLADPKYAVMVVQHNYQPTQSIKMDGQQQLPYPRKNWSSMILWNCDHPSNKALTLEKVNTEPGSYLHRFQWLKDNEIGSLPYEWNWLVNWYHENPKQWIDFSVVDKAVERILRRYGFNFDLDRNRFFVSSSDYQNILNIVKTKQFVKTYGKEFIKDKKIILDDTGITKPKAIHYTEGGPWFNNYEFCDYSGEWKQYMREYKAKDLDITAIIRSKQPLDFDQIEREFKKKAYNLFVEVCKNEAIVNKKENDPELVKNDIWDYKRFVKKTMNMMLETDYPAMVVASARNSKIVHAKRFQYEKENIPGPYVIRGIASKDLIEYAIETKQDYYFIETGYFGNYTNHYNIGAKKLFHRLAKNNMQQEYILDVPDDRWKLLSYLEPKLEWTGWKKNGRKILLITPSQKPCQFYNIDKDKWISETISKIKEHTDRPIEIREKALRRERTDNSIYDAFDNDVFCIVTYNSIAAVEAIAYGIPAFALAPTAAKHLASTDLSKLESPYYPDEGLVQKWCHSLAYGQFHVNELINGTALQTVLNHDKYKKIYQ